MTTATIGMSPEQTLAALHTLLEGPAMSPPAGIVPTFDNPANLDNYATVCNALVITFATVAVVLRMYTKVFILRVLAWEDYVIVLAWLLQTGEIIPYEGVIRHGGGRHMWDIQLKTFFAMLYWVNVATVIYAFVIFSIKLSILLQYLRIFAPTRKGNMFIYVGSHLSIWSNLIFYVIAVGFAIALCTPREKIWNPLLQRGHCFSFDALFQATGIFNVISDFAILILPMPCVWKLRMPLKKKVLMTAIFATGLFACIASIIRTYYIWTLFQSPDISYTIVPIGMWTYAEHSIGICVSCLPVIPKFFQHTGPKLSSALTTLRSRFTTNTTKNSAINGSASSAKSPSVQTAAAEREKLKLPSFKNTFTSVFSSVWKEHDHELYDGQSLPNGEYGLLHEGSAVPRCDDTSRDVGQMPPVNLATMRDDLEKGRGRF